MEEIGGVEKVDGGEESGADELDEVGGGVVGDV